MTEYVLAPEQPVETDLSMTEDLFVKWYSVPIQGTFLPQHSHSHDHVTVVAAGAIDTWAGEMPAGAHYAPSSFVVPAHQQHTFRTLLPNTVILCCHRSDYAVEEENQLV